MTIYTTEPLAKVRKSGKVASVFLGEEIVWKRVKAPEKPLTRIDSEGDRKIDWIWLRAYLQDRGVFGFHFTPTLRRKWQLATSINGTSNKIMGVPHFYFCANPRKKAKGYPFSEVTRLILHERMHAKTTTKAVHDADYKKKAIHLLAQSFKPTT